MKKLVRVSIYIAIVIAMPFSLFAQEKTEIKSEESLSIGLEYRPRTEFRHGYRSIPSDDANPGFFTSHRGRFNVDYTRSDFKFHAIFQDIRVWGDSDPTSPVGKAQFYEFYVEPKITEHLSVRVGRQRIKYDNQRLFAENNWRQSGGAHDAARFMYKTDKVEADLIGAFNQPKASDYGTDYNIGWDWYRSLIANFIKVKLNKNWTLTTINFADEYTDDALAGSKGYWKYTHGGRLAYQTGDLYFTFAAYYQWGKIDNGKEHSGYYWEPEVKWKATKKYSIRLGAQVLSGDDNPNDSKSSAFITKFAAVHAHNGRMDYLHKTVRTNEHEGVINPYLFQDFKLSKQVTLKLESHIFATQQELTVYNEANQAKKLDRYYAFENDIRLIYKPNSYTTIEFAYMFLKADDTIKALKTGQGGNIDNLAQFAYLQVNWAPQILNLKW